jgi:methylphosphotriester-DNA--protein-cysteine methyltransferase
VIDEVRLEAGMRLISQALSRTSLDALASAIGKDDSQASRIRSGQLGATVQDVARMLYASGLKVVSADRVCVHQPTYQAMATIAARAMADQEIAQRLTWDDLQ